MRTLRCTTLAFTAVVGAASCGYSGLAFRIDDRVDIVHPADHAEIQLPLTVRWEADGVLSGGDAEAFGILVDQAPPRPGATLESLFSGDETCRAAPPCPDREYLAARNVFTTTHRAFRVERVAPTDEGRRREVHELTIVLLDRAGRRLGEAAWSVRFKTAEGA